jgi:hypothetical protein
LTIQCGVFVDHAVDGEVFEHFLSGGVCEATGVFGVVGEAADLAGEDDSVADGEDDAGFVVGDEFQIRGNVGGENREAGAHGFHEAIGLAFEITGEDEGIEAGEEFAGVVSVAQECDAVGDTEVGGEVFEIVVEWAVTGDDEVDIIAGAFEEFDGPDDILDSFLGGEATDDADDEGVRMVCRPLAAEFFAVRMRQGRGGIEGEAVADDLESGVVVAELAVEVDDGLGVADEFGGAADEFFIEPELPGCFPGIDAAFGDDDRGAGGAAGDEAAVGVACEEPGVDEIGLPGADEGAEFPEGEGIELQSLVEEIDGDASGGELVGIGAGAGEDDDADVELVAGEACREECELFFGSRFVEGGDDQEQAYHGLGQRVWELVV